MFKIGINNMRTVHYFLFKNFSFIINTNILTFDCPIKLRKLLAKGKLYQLIQFNPLIHSNQNYANANIPGILVKFGILIDSVKENLIRLDCSLNLKCTD